jgi:hypothetical protein
MLQTFGFHCSADLAYQKLLFYFRVIVDIRLRPKTLSLSQQQANNLSSSFELKMYQHQFNSTFAFPSFPLAIHNNLKHLSFNAINLHHSSEIMIQDRMASTETQNIQPASSCISNNATRIDGGKQLHTRSKNELKRMTTDDYWIL